MSQCVTQKNGFTVFSVKVTVRSYIIKIWLFLLYLLNCSSVCNQTWFGGTASWAQVFCKEVGCSKSRSYQRFKMLVNVCPDIFWTAKHFVTKLAMMVQHHEPEYHTEKKKKKKLFAIFRVKVKARAHMIRIWIFLLYLMNCWFLGRQTWSADASP